MHLRRWSIGRSYLPVLPAGDAPPTMMTCRCYLPVLPAGATCRSHLPMLPASATCRGCTSDDDLPVLPAGPSCRSGRAPPECGLMLHPAPSFTRCRGKTHRACAPLTPRRPLAWHPRPPKSALVELGHQDADVLEHGGEHEERRDTACTINVIIILVDANMLDFPELPPGIDRPGD